MMNKHKPFRFGLDTRGAAPRQEWLDKARKVEDLGYSTYSVWEPMESFAPIVARLSGK